MAVGTSDAILIDASVLGFGFLTATMYLVLWLRARGMEHARAAAVNYNHDQP
jgi:hypothetical protein